MQYFIGECDGSIVAARPTMDQSQPGAKYLLQRAFCKFCYHSPPSLNFLLTVCLLAAGAAFGWDPIFEPVDGQVAGQPAKVCDAAAAASRVRTHSHASIAVAYHHHQSSPLSLLTSLQTFGEMTMEQKALVSHRGKALRSLQQHLLSLVA